MPHHLSVSLLLLSVLPTASSLHVHSHLGLGIPPRSLPKGPLLPFSLSSSRQRLPLHTVLGEGGRGASEHREEPGGGNREEKKGEASQPPLADSGREAPPPPARLSPPLLSPPKNAAQIWLRLSCFTLQRVLGPPCQSREPSAPVYSGSQKILIASLFSTEITFPAGTA